MIKTLKENFYKSRGYWLMMGISFVVLFIYFSQNLEELLKIALTWTFAISWHKIFVDDLIIPKFSKEAKNEHLQQ